MLNLTEIISKLQSDKVKPRQEALGLLEEAFVATDTLVNTFGSKTNEWLAIFRALFAAVCLEKAACSKKGFDRATPIALARLEKTGSTLRSVTQRCIPLLTKKVIRELLNHLVDSIIYRGELVPSLSLNYVKVILGICSHKPHLEHLSTDMWISLCSLAFAAILGDNLSEPGFGDDSEEELDVDVDMDIDGATPHSGVSSGSSRKRRRSRSPPPQPDVPTSRSQSTYTASPEQIDFMSLLVVLFRSPYAPFTSPGMSQKILNRLHRFFATYTAWGNAHQSAVVAINVVLGQVELNLKACVIDFALKIWPLLLSHWPHTRRSKAAKEELTLVITTLLPFITLPEVAEVAKNGARERIEALYACFENDIRHPSGSEALSLDTLRLCLREPNAEKKIFEANTFRSGFGFSPLQVLSWTTLELYADCVKALHIYSEQYSGPVKRRKIETPLADILACVRNASVASKIRLNKLQLMLFFIDRHWDVLPEFLQQEIFSVLIEILAHDDQLVQSWAFLCFAAIACFNVTAPGGIIDWDTMWSHCVRRTNALHVCRAASHAAHAILSSQRLPIHRVLADIEAVSNDLVVQGPTFPYDSVCAFLCDCLRIASQDMRLHRLKLPDKVLSWVSETWSMPGHTRSTILAHTVSDILALLEATCGFSKTSNIPCRFVLPDCILVEAAIQRHRTAGIREYILHSRLPPFLPSSLSSSRPVTAPLMSSESIRLAPPTPREIKLSNFLFKYLELLFTEWQNIKDVALDSRPERVRRSLDVASISLFFEASLIRNGSQSTKQVFLLACKLVDIVTPCIELPRWNVHERALILLGLEPLVFEDARREDDPWDLMPGPDAGSGLKRDTLRRLGRMTSANTPSSLSPQRALQVLVWQNADVQATFEGVLKALRNVLKIVFKPDSLQSWENLVDRDDGFTPTAVVPDARVQEFGGVGQLCVEICTTFLAVAPMLQSGTFSATRDKELSDFLLNCEPSVFLRLAPEFFQAVRRKQLHVSVSTVEKFGDRIHDLLNRSYDFASGIGAPMLAIQFLHSTSHIWMQPASSVSDLVGDVRLLYGWFATSILEGKLRSWRIRDRFICFLDYHMTVDPLETLWTAATRTEGDLLVDEKLFPSRILPKMADDDDTRVRCRAAVANARLLSLADVKQTDPMQAYAAVKNELSRQTDVWEHMLTRFIHLGNAMVACSAVRRGPYWHLLEVCLYTSSYNDAVRTVVSAVADRLGFPNLRSLSEAYASQLVESVISSQKDYFGFPPSLLGYDDRRQCARATFPLLAQLILAAGDPTEVEHRRKLFQDHCSKARKSVQDGLFECFADIVGTKIVRWIEGNYEDEGLSPELSQSLRQHVHQFAIEANPNVEPVAFTLQNLDRIIFAILRTVCDEDYSNNGSIVQALKSYGRSERAVPTFNALMIYRKPTDFKMHRPNLPAFSAFTVLRSLGWLSQELSDVFAAPVIYHVLNHLFAAIGRSMLVNEQMRLLQALSIWISINGSSFKDMTLLRTLMQGTIMLLDQYDLAHYAQGILEWAFHHYTSPQSLVPKFPELLGRIARTAHDYSREAHDPALVGLGNELLDWVEKQAWKLSGVARIKDQILRALSLWPRQPQGPLAQVAQEFNHSQSLSEILQNQHVKSGKFRLVRRLRDFVNLGLYSQENFYRRDFWSLKSCIPSPEEIQDEDIDAFVEVLFKTAAQIVPSQGEIETSKTIGNMHQKASWKIADGRRENFKAVSPQRSIVLSLLDILSGDVPSQIHRAYTTLRLILALSTPELAMIQDWPTEFKKEIMYLSSCPLPTAVASLRSLDELQLPNFAVSKDFSRWVCQFSLLLNDVLARNDRFYAQLSSFIQLDPLFAAQMLPTLVHGLLLYQRNEARTVLSDYFRSILSEDMASSHSRKAVVETVLHLRNFTPPPADTVDPLAYDKWLDIDFRLLSRGAISCGAYTTALLFLELAADYSESSPDTDATAEQILYEIYSHIEEPDGFYAIKSNDVHKFLTRRFHHEGQWDKAFQFNGANFASGSEGGRGAEGILPSLHSNGFDQLAMAVLQSSNSEAWMTTASSELGYQIAWRTELWDLPDPPSNEISALYATLRAVHRGRDPFAVDILLKNALRQEMLRLYTTGIEDMVGVRERARTLLCLGEIKKWRDESLQDKLAVQDVAFTSWADFVGISPDFDFTTLESIVATRMSLLRSIKLREQRDQLGDMESSLMSGLRSLEQRCLVRLSQAARRSEHHQIALNATIHAQRLGKAPTFEASEEFAHVLWLQKEHKLAVEYLKGLVHRDVQSGISDAEVARNALILSQLGAWSAEACLQKPTEIREQYFHKATTSILGSGSEEVSARVDPALAVIFHQYALFAEDQYHAILRSPEVSRLKIYVERKKHEIEQIKESMGRTQSHTPQYQQLSQYQKKAEEIYGEDVAQFSVHTETRSTFLIQAIEMYSRCLQASNDFDDNAVIRLCSLWFANFNDDKIQSNFNRAIERVPSRKFIFLSHQLSARLSKPENNGELSLNQKYLQNLTFRMCNEHPFHSVYQVWALQEGTSDSGRRQSSRGATLTTQKGRASAAADILAMCRLQSHNTERVKAIELLCKAYLEWAKYPLKQNKSLMHKAEPRMPENLILRKISNLPVPVTTAHTPLDYTLRYDNIVTIEGYSQTFTLAGGINLPKISVCLGNDGRKYRQLFKGEGNDDLRQDAVMEQVFELVNIVLKRDRETRKRQLSVRCYKVIPLAPQAGLLEFVQNTMPIGQWLVSAHKRYRPQDIDLSTCTTTLKNYREKRHGVIDDPAGLCSVFLALLQRFRPVFRHFFTERNKLPTAWFATRLMYARSVATTSIVGHVLGLGDRHVSNILIDKSTGELVHIDLGIAFDQGKRLPIPELVPFRLTGDMVDGLGTAGTEGVFRRCAEETLRVLRAESGVITTVLEVFRHDPLYSWTASAIKIQRVQGSLTDPTGAVGASTTFGLGIDMASDSVDESADRALTSVHRKLDKSLSVEYTVNELIVSATDPMNLSQIFAGWNPCL